MTYHYFQNQQNNTHYVLRSSDEYYSIALVFHPSPLSALFYNINSLQDIFQLS